MTDGVSSGAAEPVAVLLPMRQRNALRVLLNKSNISPEEVAALEVRVIERAPGIGKKGLELIDNWLRSHGYRLSGLPCRQINRLQIQQRKQRRIEEAIKLLRVCGYEVRRVR